MGWSEVKPRKAEGQEIDPLDAMQQKIAALESRIAALEQAVQALSGEKSPTTIGGGEDVKTDSI